MKARKTIKYVDMVCRPSNNCFVVRVHFGLLYVVASGLRLRLVVNFMGRSAPLAASGVPHTKRQCCVLPCCPGNRTQTNSIISGNKPNKPKRRELLPSPLHHHPPHAQRQFVQYYDMSVRPRKASNIIKKHTPTHTPGSPPTPGGAGGGAHAPCHFCLLPETLPHPSPHPLPSSPFIALPVDRFGRRCVTLCVYAPSCTKSTR